MKFLFYYSAVLTFLIGFSSCKKDKIEVGTPVSPGKLLEPSAELKAYTLFKPGSYWMYKNTTDNSIDSLYVKAVETFSNPTNLNYHISFGLEDSLPEYNHLFGHFVLMKQAAIDLVQVDGISMFSTDSTYLVPSGRYGILENKYIGLVTIQNQNYDSCRYIKCMNRNYDAPSQTFFDYTCELIWRKHIGIVKFQQSGQPDFNSWELISYDVKQ